MHDEIHDSSPHPAVRGARRRRSGRGLARSGVLVLCLGLLGACGSDPGTLAEDDAEALHSDIQSIRAAAEQGQEPAVLRAVEDFRAAVRGLVDAREIDARDAMVLLTQVDQLAASLESPVAPSTPPPAAAEQAQTGAGDKKSVKKRGKDKRDDRGKGRDRGRGGDDDDDDD